MNPILALGVQGVVHRSVQEAADQGGLFGGGSLGTVLLIVGMVLSVAVVSGLGFIARMNDRAADRKAAQRVADDPGPAEPPAG